MISIITPVFKESAELLKSTLKHLSGFSAVSQVVVAATTSDPQLGEIQAMLEADFSQNKKVNLIRTANAGRAVQMNAGARQASEEILLFVHADTRLPDNADSLVCKELKKNWGRFDVQLDNVGLAYQIISWFINKRSRLTGISTGDQGLFVHRDLFEKMGGFVEQPLMEDVEFCKQAKKYCQPVFISEKVITSARRWQESGIIKTVLLMWWLRALYFFGLSPQYLARMYRAIR